MAKKRDINKDLKRTQYLAACITPGEALYPTTFEGMGMIQAFVERAGAPAKAQRGGVR